MPQAVEDCRRRLMADPDFKPRKGSTKEEAAWAVCMSTVGKGKSMEDAYELIRKERKSYSIPSSVKAEAKRGLAWRKEFGRGGTSVGLNTARTLANDASVGEAKIRHIAKYFPRHESDKSGKGWKRGDEGYPSNGRIAWALWGGEAGKAWSSEKVRVLNREEKNMTLRNMLFKGRGAVEDQIKHLRDMLRNDFSPKLKEMLRDEIRRLEAKLSNMDKGYGDKEKKKCPNCGYKE